MTKDIGRKAKQNILQQPSRYHVWDEDSLAGRKFPGNKNLRYVWNVEWVGLGEGSDAGV